MLTDSDLPLSSFKFPAAQAPSESWSMVDLENGEGTIVGALPGAANGANENGPGSVGDCGALQTSKAPPDLASLRFLLVDDEAPNRRIGCRYLTQLKVPATQITLLFDGAWSVVAFHDDHTGTMTVTSDEVSPVCDHASADNIMIMYMQGHPLCST